MQNYIIYCLITQTWLSINKNKGKIKNSEQHFLLGKMIVDTEDLSILVLKLGSV